MQQIIIILILITTFGIIAWKLYKMFTQKSEQSHRCVGCSADCKLDGKKKDG